MRPVDSQIDIIFQSRLHPVHGLNVKEIADWHVVVWANLSWVLSARFKADYHSDKSFNLCSKAEIDACRFHRRKREKVSWLWSGVFVQMRVMAAITQNCEAFKRFTDMDFLQIRVINFSGHLMRGRWEEKEGDGSQIALLWCPNP